MSRFLLDTHVLLWSLSQPEHLHPDARDTIRGAQNQVFVSTATVWEMAIKSALGKLTVPDDLEAQLRLNRFDILNITLAHARAIEHLPLLHRDPFDRMLVVQAQHEGLTLITRDALIQQYAVSWMIA